MQLSPSLKDSVKAGIAAGQVGSWAIFGMILAVDAHVVVPTGTFYQMVGAALGVDGQWPAIYFGFVLHMITGTAIGIIYMVISDSARPLRISSTFKGLATGAATGIAVWGIFFMPIHFGLMQPTLQQILLDSPAESQQSLAAARLIEMSDFILYGALAMHIVFGGVLGFCGRLATSSRVMLDENEAGAKEREKEA